MDPHVININKKYSMGRRKIEIKKIEEKNSRQVTFSKRRTGLFRKASEFCILTGAEAAIFVVSPKGKIFTFGHPSVEAIIGRYMQDDNNLEGSEDNYCEPLEGPFWQILEDLKELRVLEAKRDRLKAMNKHNLVQRDVNGNGKSENWWDRSVEGMELEELEKFMESLEELKKKLELKAVENDMQTEMMSTQLINSGDMDEQLEMDEEGRKGKSLAIVPRYKEYDFGLHNSGL